MTIVNILQAKTDLSKLIARAEAGEEIVLARGNKPVAKLVALAAPTPSVRGYGSLAHLRGKIPDAFFFDPLPEAELKLWEGGD